MSRHILWRDVPARVIVDTIYDDARCHGGECCVHIAAGILRIEQNALPAWPKDRWAVFRTTEPRVEVERRLLAAFLLAVGE